MNSERQGVIFVKLITAIVNKDDSSSVQTALTKDGYQVTRTASTGGFLKTGNVTFIMAVEDDKVDPVIAIIAKQSKQRKQLVPSTSAFGASGIEHAYPVEVIVGGATIIVQDIIRFEKL